MTKRHAWVLIALVAVVLTVGVLWFAMAKRGAAADIQQLASLIARADEAGFKQAAEAMAKKYKDRRLLMKLFKRPSKQANGPGAGLDLGTIQPEGIEAKIRSLANKAPSALELEQQGTELVRMSQFTAAVAEVTKHQCEVGKRTGHLDPVDWRRWCEGMQQSSLSLADAVKAKDGAKVKAAAARVQSNCTSCHRIFRE
jgi:hypothetical protein